MNIEPQPSSYSPDPQIVEIADIIGHDVQAADFPKTVLRYRNDRWAATIGLEGFSDAQWVRHFGRFEPLDGNLPSAMALAYHGHQFRVYNPQIGDGRGFLFAQMRDHLGRLMDLGTKGSGQTPFSRDGDGRLTLKGAVREILATEMLEALGVETSKTFSVIETGESLWRGDEPSPTRSAVLVRLNHSHIRFGTFQRLAQLDDTDGIHRLIAYALRNYYSDDAPTAEIGKDDAPAFLLGKVVERFADQAASYMVAGFVHGVLNTDNMNITGESFDYGPWRFAPDWTADFTAAYFDHQKIYAFGRQPEAIHWNLGQLAVALRLVSDAPPLITELERFGPLYQAALCKRFCWRLGVTSQGFEKDNAMIQAAEQLMRRAGIGIDVFFHNWMGGKPARSPQFDSDTGDAATSWAAFAAAIAPYKQARSRDHPYWQSQNPQSMLIDEVETIWAHIADNDDWAPLEQKIADVRTLGAALRSG